MNIEIITNPLQLNISGFSGKAIDGDYSGTAFRLMDRMWHVVKENNLENKGRNIWIYEPNELVFAGVELECSGVDLLEQKQLVLSKYAYFKHVGSYQLIKQVGVNMRTKIEQLGHAVTSPYIEIYGHWINDETKLETELLMSLR